MTTAGSGLWLSISHRAEVGGKGGVLDPSTEAAINAARGGGVPLESSNTRKHGGCVRNRLGHVRLHAGPASADLNERIQARAFTVGSDIFFRSAVPDAHTPKVWSCWPTN